MDIRHRQLVKTHKKEVWVDGKVLNELTTEMTICLKNVLTCLTAPQDGNGRREINGKLNVRSSENFMLRKGERPLWKVKIPQKGYWVRGNLTRGHFKRMTWCRQSALNFSNIPLVGPGVWTMIGKLQDWTKKILLNHMDVHHYQEQKTTLKNSWVNGNPANEEPIKNANYPLNVSNFLTVPSGGRGKKWKLGNKLVRSGFGLLNVKDILRRREVKTLRKNS